MSTSKEDVRIECRAKPRVPLEIEVTCQGKQPAVQYGKSRNISESGMMIRSAEMLPLESIMTVRFTLPIHPHTIAVRAKATSVWMAHGYSIGIQFLGLEEERREAIAKFVEQVQSQRD